MDLKDIVMKGGILPAMLSDKLVAKDEARMMMEEEMKKKAAQGPAGTQAVAGTQPVAGQGMKRGGKVSSASGRADGAAQRGKTRGKMV
jgi:hypothetical protein